MFRIRHLESKLRIPRINIPEVKIIGEWESIIQFLGQVWEIEIVNSVALKKVAQINVCFQEVVKEEVMSEAIIKIELEGKEKMFKYQAKGEIGKYLNQILQQAENKIKLNVQFFLSSSTSFPKQPWIDTNYKLSPIKLLESTLELQPHSQDIRTPVLLLLNSSSVVTISSLNWRVHYIGVLLAHNQNQQLKEAGLYYSRRYKSIQWAILPTASHTELPEYLPTQNVKTGVRDLQKMLRGVLMKSVARVLDQTKREYTEKSLKIQGDIKKLGGRVPEEGDGKLKFVWNLISESVTQYSNQIRGKGTVHNSPGSSHSFSSTSLIYSGGLVLKALFRDIYSQLTLTPILSHLTNSSLQRMIKMYQNDSIPGFPSIQSFRYILTPDLNKLKQPAIDLVNDISNYLRVIYSKVFRNKFSSYWSEIVSEILNIVDEYMDRLRQETLEIVLGNIDCELEIMMSNDNEYNQRHSDLIPKQSSYKNINETTNRVKQESFSLKDNRDKQAKERQSNIIESFRSRVEDYFLLVVRVLRDLIPKNCGYFLIMESQRGMQFEVCKGLMQKKEVVMRIRETKEVGDKREEWEREIRGLREKIGVIGMEEAKIL